MRLSAYGDYRASRAAEPSTPPSRAPGARRASSRPAAGTRGLARCAGFATHHEEKLLRRTTKARQDSLLGALAFYLVGVFDAFSRAPLVLHLLRSRAHASDAARLLKAAVRAFGAPKYLITDLGGEFRDIFEKTATRLGAKQRFASALNIYANARLERFWRTLKDTASLRLRRPLTIEDLERRLETALA